MAKTLYLFFTQNMLISILLVLFSLSIYLYFTIKKPFDVVKRRLFFIILWMCLILMMGSISGKLNILEDRVDLFFFYGFVFGSFLLLMIYVAKIFLIRAHWVQNIWDKELLSSRPSSIEDATIPYLINISKIPSNTAASILMDALEKASDERMFKIARILQIAISEMIVSTTQYFSICLVCGHVSTKSKLSWCSACGSRAWFKPTRYFPAFFYHLIVPGPYFDIPAKCVCCLKPTTNKSYFTGFGRVDDIADTAGQKITYTSLPVCHRCLQHEVEKESPLALSARKYHKEIAKGNTLRGHVFYNGFATVGGKQQFWDIDLNEIHITFQNPTYAKDFYELNGERRCPKCRIIQKSLHAEKCHSCSEPLEVHFDHKYVVEQLTGHFKTIFERSRPCPKCGMWYPIQENKCPACHTTAESISLW
jgi:hypothetical protein